tara:strand:+ start:16548 stop:17654 length:1107 start_codon:yes stop_codon:yes gene_type:complete
MSWQQPDENSIAALEHGMLFADGVEFDVKLDSDHNLVIYHDELLPGNSPKKERCIELLGTDELKKNNIPLFEDLLSSKKFTEALQQGGKTACIEFKMPHPVAKINHSEYLTNIMTQVEEKLNDFELPKRSTIVYSFSPKIESVAKSLGFKFPVTRLMPHLRPWGVWKVKRAIGMPNFARTSVSSIIKNSRNHGMPAMGLALQFLNGWTRWISPGVPMGLKGAALERLNKARAGMGAFVWPAPIEMEDLMINAGLSLVSDNINPELVTKSDGSIRWMRPASQPLDEEWRNILESAEKSERYELSKEARESLPQWHEMEHARRNKMIIDQGKRMYWSGSEEKWIEQLKHGIPWGSPRLLGHRGAGKTHSG